MSSDDRSSGPYEVGFGKPPRATRFRPGRSGNPNGRPSKTRNLKTDLTNELGSRIRVREGDRQISISKQEAFLKTLIARALKGDVRASGLLVSLMAKVLDVTAPPPERGLAANEQDVIRTYFDRYVAQTQSESATAASTGVSLDGAHQREPEEAFQDPEPAPGEDTVEQHGPEPAPGAENV